MLLLEGVPMDTGVYILCIEATLYMHRTWTSIISFLRDNTTRGELHYFSWKVILAPSSDILQAIDGMYSIANTDTDFLLPSVFSITGWINRQLNIDELLQLWDYSPVLIKTIR